MGKNRRNARRQVLGFVQAFIEDNGYSPTYEEIRAAVGLSSRSHAAYYLGALEREGLIRRMPRVPRSVRLVSAAAAIYQAPADGYAGARS